MFSGFILGGVLFLFDEKAIAKGLLLGTCFSVINFLLLGRSILLTLGRARPKASAIALTSIFFRYIILAIPMVVAIKSDSFNLIAVIVGIFAVQIVTMFYYTVARPLSDKRKRLL